MTNKELISIDELTNPVIHFNPERDPSNYRDYEKFRNNYDHIKWDNKRDKKNDKDKRDN